MAAVTSAASSTASFTPQPLTWWLKDPTTPSVNTPIRAMSWNHAQKRPVAKFDPVGRTRSIVLRGPVLGEEGTLQIRTLTESESDKVRTILNVQRTLLLQNVLGEQWYVEVNGDIGRNQIRAESEDDLHPVRHFYEWSIPLVEVDAP